MVIDFDDTVLARNLRNRTFTIGAPEIDSEGTLKPKRNREARTKFYKRCKACNTKGMMLKKLSRGYLA